MSEAPVKKGDRIELLRMGDDPMPMAPGSKGTVMIEPVLIQGTWSVAVKWDEGVGRSLSLVVPPDEIRVIEEAKP